MLRRKLAQTALVLAGTAAVMSLGLAVAGPASAADPVVIRNTGSNKCLQPVDESLELGAAIVQLGCNGRDAQKWVRIFGSDGTQRFMNQFSGLCLDARGGATNGTPVQQWVCNGISNEKWASALATPAITQVVSRVSGTTSHCLDDPWQSTDDGTAMQIWRCNTTSAQVWFVG